MNQEEKDQVRTKLVTATVHGIRQAIEAKNLIEKMVWYCLDLTVLAMCFIFLIRLFVEFCDYDKITNISNLDERGEFPIITICNENILTNPAYFSLVHNQVQEYKALNPNVSVQTFVTSMIRVIGYNLGPGDQRNISYRLEDILLSCSFGLSSCSAADFQWYYDKYYGNCYRFNAGFNSSNQPIPRVTQISPGRDQGLKIEIFSGFEDTSNAYDSGNGILVKASSFATYFQEDYGLGLTPGTKNNVIIQKAVEEKLNEPYNEKCASTLQGPSVHSDDAYFTHINEQGWPYNRLNCYEFMKEYLAYMKCNCTLYDPHPISSVCTLSSELTCYFNQNVMKDTIAVGDHCPSECQLISYNLVGSSVAYPNRLYAEKFLLNHPLLVALYKNRTLVYDELKKSVLSVRVYYDKLIYQKIEQIPKISGNDLFSNIGGTLGLCFGISFIGLLELTQVTALAAFYSFKAFLQHKLHRVLRRIWTGLTDCCD